jgi:exosortase
LEARTLLIEDWSDCDTQTMSDQEFLHSPIHGSLLAVIFKPHRGCWGLLLAAWTWAIWSCAEYWRANPNYSYGWIVPALGLAYAARRLTLTQSENFARPILAVPIWLILFFGIVAIAVFFGLEFAREQVWHPIVVIWTIAFIPIALTLLVCWFAGGKILLLAELFPILFFLTAVPWPPRFEQPITAGLMQAVAAATTALLHWFGIPAQTAGGAITLRTGVVGITEACSGIRSLQAGVMFGLAMGEWFLLRPLRRIALLLLAIVLALCTNLIRTLVLSLQAEWHGLDAVEKIHDLTGTLAVTVLVIAIWVSALALRSRRRVIAHFGFENLSARLRGVGAAIPPTLQRAATAVLIAGIFGIAIAQIVSAKIEARDQTQTAPFFSVREDPSQTRVQLPRDVWSELHPTTGEYIRTRDSRLGAGETFHFFWKPSPWNRFALVHRPDICMPGIGWESGGPPESITIDFFGYPMQLYLFRFRRGDIEALELWGVWRNGDAVPLDYQPDQVLRSSAAPPVLHLEGKRRSATEIVACVIGGNRIHPPEAERAIAILKSVFQYKPARK